MYFWVLWVLTVSFGGSRGLLQEGHRSVFSCLARNIDCKSTWDELCCSEQNKQTGRSMQQAANWRFGSMFRNSIPPPRPYSPPSFDDIFEKSHRETERTEKTKMNYPSSNINLKMNSYAKYPNLKNAGKPIQLSTKDVKGLTTTTTERNKNENKSAFSKLTHLQKIHLYQNLFKKPVKKESVTKTTQSTQKYVNPDYAMSTKSKYFNYKNDAKRSKIPSYQNDAPSSKTKSSNYQKDAKTSKMPKYKNNAGRTENIFNAWPQKNNKKSYHNNGAKKNSVSTYHDPYQTNFQTNTIRSTTLRSQPTQPQANSGLSYKDFTKPANSKLNRWRDKYAALAKVAKVSGQKFIDKSEQTFHFKKRPTKTTTPKTTTMVSTVTAATKQPTTTTQRLIETTKEKSIDQTTFNNDRIDNNILDNEIENHIIQITPNPYGNHLHKLDTTNPYSRSVCDKLRVPCRFVNDHPCCKLPQRIELAARSRSMDGSADLRWRSMQARPKATVTSMTFSQADGGPRRGPQGRSIDSFGRITNGYKPAQLSSFSESSAASAANGIPYNYAKSVGTVIVPRYYYNGGPQLTNTILGQCWRLTYLRCNEERKHPCCSLATKQQANKGPSSMSRLEKWIRVN